MRTPNQERLQFIRAYYRIIGPDNDPKELFEALQDTFAELKGRYVFRNYDDFKFSRIYYLNSGQVKGMKSAQINRPDSEAQGIVCPSCGSSLIFKKV